MSVFSPSNSIWPSNGIIGSEQIQIPDGVNEKWPEGDVLVGNFVYKEGKLTGFVDCKSLVINDSKTTVIPYDYAELELPSILKDTVTITRGERCKNLIVNCLEDAAVYITPMLREILGDEAKFVTEFIKEENKLIVHTDRLDDETLVTVSELLERVLPQNIVIQRANYLLPTDYKWVEYLEGTGTQYIYVPTDVAFAHDNIIVDTEHWCTRKNTRAQEGRLDPAALPCAAWGVSSADSTTWKPCTQASGSVFGSKWLYSETVAPYDDYIKYHVEYNANVMHSLINDEDIGSVTFALPDRALESFGLFTAYGNPAYPFNGKKKYFKLTVNSELTRDMIPALDPTGAPCFVDLVTKTPFYNQGTGDFLYPTDAAPVAAIGMDDKFYAKLTEHGVRRLYKVPDGCNMTKDEYATANGFKEIVEPPMPQTGYWIPEWRETDTQIVCEGIEIESPEQKIES